MLLNIISYNVVFWAKILITIIFILVPVLLGGRLGRFYKEKTGQTDHANLDPVVTAGLGLLAFMLGFTFQITASRFGDRKQLLLDEVNAMRTSYHNAGLLKDTARLECRRLISEYIDIRAGTVLEKIRIDSGISRSKEIQDSLWLQAEALAREDRSSEVYSLFISSIDHLINMHYMRYVVALQYRIPAIVLGVLYFISFFAMLTLGFKFGISEQRNIFINLLLAINFTAVMWLIFALDSPEMGIIKVNQGPLIELQQSIAQGHH